MDWAIANDMINPRWDGEKWVGEIRKLLPPVETQPTEGNKIDILEQENKVLKEQLLMHDELIFELAMMVYV